MKASKVKGLDPQGSLADNARAIVRTRLGELHGFVPDALDPAGADALHDMRIAAKRLRYVLEVTGHCFGPYADTARKRTKDLQDLIGEIHDCDEQLPRVDALIARLRAEDARTLREAAGAGAEDLEARLATRAPHGPDYRGLAALAAWLQARRELLHGRFLEAWADWGRDGVRARLEFALAEEPAVS
ncbi:MAG TPA: CHAD domain-containing protein [Solirubrobacteraceae bacterium]|nr:CHAD domain-containing protein [Solirubrobacteraceae bacterium]